MGLANYTELRATIADWLDDTTLTAQIPDFVKLLETEVQTELDDPDQYTAAPLTIVSGAASLPADFGGLISISDSTWGGLTQLSVATFQDLLPRAGYPTHYAITDGRFQVSPSGSGAVSIIYRKGVPPLASNASNWLLTRLPGLYLYGSLFHAEARGWNDKRLGGIKALKDDLMSKLLADGQRRKFGAAPLRPRMGRA